MSPTAAPRRRPPATTAELLRAVIKLSGLSNRQFANDVLGRNETTVRGWLNDPNAHIPQATQDLLWKWWHAGEIPAGRLPAPRRDPRH